MFGEFAPKLRGLLATALNKIAGSAANCVLFLDSQQQPAVSTGLKYDGSNLSCVGTGASSEHFGSGSVAAGATSLVVGNAASVVSGGTGGVALGQNAQILSSGTGGIAIGQNASAAQGTALGYSSQAYVDGLAIGYQAANTNSGRPGIAIGRSATSAAGSIVIAGYNRTSNAKEFAVGGAGNSDPINNFVPHGDTGGFAYEGWGFSSTSDRKLGKISFTYIVPTDAIRTGRAALVSTDFNGDREGVRVDSDGTQALLGFYGVAAVAKAASPGVATGTDAAVINAIITALRNLGLVT